MNAPRIALVLGLTAVVSAASIAQDSGAPAPAQPGAASRSTPMAKDQLQPGEEWQDACGNSLSVAGNSEAPVGVVTKTVTVGGEKVKCLSHVTVPKNVTATLTLGSGQTEGSHVTVATDNGGTITVDGGPVGQQGPEDEPEKDAVVGLTFSGDGAGESTITVNVHESVIEIAKKSENNAFVVNGSDNVFFDESGANDFTWNGSGNIQIQQ